MDTKLQQLKDIHLPKAINMWPVAPGWIFLFILGLSLMGYVIYFFYQKKKQRRAIKFALERLNQLQELTKYNPENINVAAEVSTLIRRTALYYFPRHAVAGLSGENWLNFLNDSGQTSQFTSALGQLLLVAPYCKNNPEDLTPLIALTKNWLNTIAKLSRKEN